MIEYLLAEEVANVIHRGDAGEHLHGTMGRRQGEPRFEQGATVYITICDFRIEGDTEAFDAWFLERAAVLRQLPGNLRYELLKDVTHPERRTVNEVWETMDDHLAHLVHPVHVEIIAFGSEHGMRDLAVHHWERAEGHISQARARTEQRREDPEERPEMYRMIEELRTEHSTSGVGGEDRS